jgi:peptidoglycan hydrolase-like protein with peptidoglycan-binding domain
MSADWPCPGYKGPQPWEAENTPELTQSHRMISSGDAGDEVAELASLLAYLGYATTISAGQNPYAAYDSGVSDAVRAFCADYGVEEDPTVRRARTEDTVGPWIWEALTRAVNKKLAEQDKQGS